MKKLFALVLVVCVFVIALTSCGTPAKNGKNITIVTTVFPEYDWVRQILGDYSDGIELILLVQNGTDLHSYQPTVSDMAVLSDCDILIRTGGMSDFWIDDALASAPDKDRIVIELMDLMTKSEKLIEQSLHHNKEHSHEHDDHGHAEDTHDEHVWLSLKLAARFCQVICDAICEKVPENAEAYLKNCAKYVETLKALDKMYTQNIDQFKEKVLLFADRFPFSYLTHDYGLHCFAAFPGCSAESEASFETIAFLSEQVDRYSLPAVIILENSDQTIAETVIAATDKKNAQIVIMNSLQSVTKKDMQNGVTYLEIMTQNLDAILSSLNQ